MKNLKKLDRNQLKTINGSGWLDDILITTEELIPIIVPVINFASSPICNVQCTINGIVQIKLLACGSTC